MDRFTMFRKVWRFGAVAAVVAMVFAGEALGALNGRPQPSSNIFVAKTQAILDNFEVSGYTTIQKAVNAAKRGEIIEILDEGAYNEQVTIDGRDNAPWGSGVVGGKNGITIRYIPPSATATARPTVTWTDNANVYPKTCAEAKVQGDTLKSSGNFETNGAVRIIRARDIVIEGLIIDGGGANTFAYSKVWSNEANCSDKGGCGPEGDYTHACPLYHGNAAVAVAVSGNVQIRDCELKNAHFGIAVKDRNTGGVFGNPNKADNDFTIPLSGFGKTGNHLFEYNKIHNNDLGLFFESSWDLGSTVRYNLIYSNYMTKTGASATDVTDSDRQHGAIGFKDNFLSPIAIYNNTLHDNNVNFIGFYQIGYQHLIFNNIFSVPHTYGKANAKDWMMIDHMFPNRMKHCVFAADDQKPQSPANEVRFNKFRDLNGSPAAGARILGSKDGNDGGFTFPNDANVRWLEPQFQSTVAGTANFLVPDWNNTAVNSYIRKQGWPAGGIMNEDGSVADLGAIPYSGKRPCSSPLDQKSRVRVSPFSVVTVSGTAAAAKFYVTEEVGKLTDLKIKYVRWIAPVPDNSESFGNDVKGPFTYTDKDGNRKTRAKRGVVIGGGDTISTPTTTGAVVVGSNRITFTLPRALRTGDEYGFFEIVIEGKDANGNAVTTDVGFLPYRVLEYTLKIEVVQNGSVVTKVRAGDPVMLRVTPMKGNATYSQTKLNEAEFTLLPDLTTHIWESDTKEFITVKDLGPGKAEYENVFFKNTGDIIISGAGLYQDDPKNPKVSLSFLGESALSVTPGVPAKVEFKNPPSASRSLPATINSGVPFEVRIEVQDKYGNPVDAAEPVTVRSLDMAKGNVGPYSTTGAGITATAPASAVGTSDRNTGIATVTAMVTGGLPKQEFDLVATIAADPVGDKGTLRIGRSSDNLRVFYADAGANANTTPTSVGIEGNVGEWFKVTVKAVGAGDTLLTSRTGFVLVTPNHEGLLLSDKENGAAETMFQLTGGVATFWISADRDVPNGCVDVSALRTKLPTDLDMSVIGNGRCDIVFKKPTGNILRAVVYGDGHGRPDSLKIYYAATSGGSFTGASPLALPDKVTLEWPALATAAEPGVLITAPKANITAVDELVLLVKLTDVRGADVPTGFTSFANDGRGGMVKVYGGAGKGADEIDDAFDLLDAVGPVLSDRRDKGGNPRIIENLNPGVAADTIVIRVSEQLRDLLGAVLIGTGGTMFYTKDPNPINEPAVGGTPLEVLDAWMENPEEYKVVVAAVQGGLKEGNWVRLNPAGQLVDRGGRTGEGFTHPDNKPHANNRWVQLELNEVAPTVMSAYYTSNPVTGMVDYAYVTFNKAVDINKWFAGNGGFVKIEKVQTSITAANAGTYFSVDPSDPTVLIVDLAEAYNASQKNIRTSGDMPVSFGFVSANEWGPADGSARDGAKPVLAGEVILKIGSLTDEGEETPDTLVVVYSERPSDAAIRLPQPVTILSGSGCNPILKEGVGSNAEGSFYRVTYVVDNLACDRFPEAGDYVRVNNNAGFDDAVTPPNVQDVADNLKQLLKIERGPLKWTVKVKSNPFRSDPSGTHGVGVSLEPGAKGATPANVDVTVKILVFDNLGSLVINDSLKTKPDEKKIDWRWNGYNNKGRLVGTGTYMFKAVCEAVIKGEAGGIEDRQRYSVTKSLGVVRH